MNLLVSNPSILLLLLTQIAIAAAALASVLLGRLRTKKQYSKSTFEALWAIEKVVLETQDFNEATQKVTNIILTQLGYLNLGYEVIVLSLLDNEKNQLKRIAISKTVAADKFLQASPIPFQDIIIPLSATDNLSVKAITDRKMYTTDSVSDVLRPALANEWVENFQRVLGIKTSIVYPILAKDKVLGSLIFSLSKEKIKISDYEWSVLDSFVGAVGIAVDNALLFKSLTETTAALKAANERLQQLDKLKDEFVSLASHELRTPMTVIKSYLWLLLQSKVGAINEKQKEYMERAYFSTERLINLVNDMLNVSRIESGRLTLVKKEVQLLDIVQKLVSEMQARAQEQGIALSFEKKSETLPTVFADPERVEQVLINLIGNSIKFTSKGGFIKVVLNMKDSMLVTSVEDNGGGIKAEDIGKLFQKFNLVGNEFLRKKNAQGTGLGLYISKAIVELQNGKIWVESAGEGKGAMFSFTLPIFNPEVHKVDNPDHPTEKVAESLPQTEVASKA